jgi:hypothetical protein
MWADVLARFEKKAPASVMAKLALEQAIAPEWVDQVFEEHRQRQYSRELLFSTIVKLMSLVSLGLKPSLHAAAATGRSSCQLGGPLRQDQSYRTRAVARSGYRLCTTPGSNHQTAGLYGDAAGLAGSGSGR